MNVISPAASTREWLETDALGGFASGTATGIRTRRYHALLLVATTPPTGRLVLVNGFDAWIETPAGRFAMTSQGYAPDVVGGDGAQRIEEFSIEPWPRWRFRFEDGTEIEQELFVTRGAPLTVLAWRLVGKAKQVKLFVRPFLSGRDYHSLHKENAAFRFHAEVKGGQVSWRPYDGIPEIVSLANATYTHEPHWYRNFQYDDERARGLDFTEDLAAPGVLQWDLAREAVWMLTTRETHDALPQRSQSVTRRFAAVRAQELRRRREFPSRLHRAADDYIVHGRKGKTIIAGYPWFTDWGRDTFIALRGLCLASGRLDDARDILLAWATAVSEGMLPNRFPDHGEQPEFNAVDASLWYVIALHEYLEARRNCNTPASANEQAVLLGAVEDILAGYARGTRYGIRQDADGLLACGVPGVQLTWMDAKVGDWVVTPRIGKPVEIQALWLNALKIGAAISPRWQMEFDDALAAFRARFWNEAVGCLYDVIDCDHRPGAVDASFRPNQILAVGGLPFALLEGEQALRVVATVEARLWVPLGLRSLAPFEPGYTPHYVGGVRERDGSYHQGTVWPWLIGPFVEAWVRVRGNTNAARREARAKFLAPLLAHLDDAGLGHISEITDAEPPHTPRGCPFQAWSVGEALRLDRVILAETKPSRTPRRPRELVAA
ncbi:MAG: amylo-alpha-1,6-glucosidase [Verrucomicrobiota bacterium]